MASMHQLTFYTKLNCHLCEEAYQILLGLIDDISMQIEVVDIALPHNQAVAAVYGERIPVLAKAGSPMELDWPFSPDEVRHYLAS
jgi:hypothetical protein